MSKRISFAEKKPKMKNFTHFLKASAFEKILFFETLLSAVCLMLLSFKKKHSKDWLNNSIMKKATKPFEHIYIFITGFNTELDGKIMAIFALDEYSRYAFNPILNKELTTDHELQLVLKKLFDSIFREYKPGIHAESTTFITNLPDITGPFIRETITGKHSIVFNEKETQKAVKPIIDKIM